MPATKAQLLHSATSGVYDILCLLSELCHQYSSNDDLMSCILQTRVGMIVKKPCLLTQQMSKIILSLEILLYSSTLECSILFYLRKLFAWFPRIPTKTCTQASRMRLHRLMLLAETTVYSIRIYCCTFIITIQGDWLPLSDKQTENQYSFSPLHSNIDCFFFTRSLHPSSAAQAYIPLHFPLFLPPLLPILITYSVRMA